MPDPNEISPENSQNLKEFLDKINIQNLQILSGSSPYIELDAILGTAFNYLTSQYWEGYLAERGNTFNGYVCSYDYRAKCTKPLNQTCARIDCLVWVEIFGKLEREE